MIKSLFVFTSLNFVLFILDDLFIRQCGTKRLDDLQCRLLEIVTKTLPKSRQERARDCWSTKESLQSTYEAALKDLEQKFNELTDKYMAIPKYTVIPCYENLFAAPLSYDKIEREVIEQYKQIELAHKQQIIMKKKIRFELSSQSQFKEDIIIDNNFIEIIGNQHAGIANNISVMDQVADKVQDFAGELNKE